MNSRRFFLAAAATPLLLPVIEGARTVSPPAREDARRLPNVALETHDGRQVRFYDELVKGRLVVINMMYANCSKSCPTNTANLLRVQEALKEHVGRDIFMYSLTLQPAIDRPDDLRRYRERFGIGPGWTFLTGAPAQVELLRRRLGFYTLDAAADSDPGAHTGMLRIGHDARDRWSMMPALATPRQIINAISNYL